MARYKWILLVFCFIVHHISTYTYYPNWIILQDVPCHKLISRGPVTMTPLFGGEKTVRPSYGLPSAGVIYSIYIYIYTAPFIARPTAYLVFFCNGSNLQNKISASPNLSL